MSVNKKIIQQLAGVSKIRITPEEEEFLSKEIGMVLDWIAKLNEVDTENVDPLYTTSTEVNVMRDDEAVIPECSGEDLLRSAPGSNSAYFKVPAL
jgi:aspartyl-tRNA(Asn)/glutamyl-tRNA(Gln) amidotransferase subunit C